MYPIWYRTHASIEAVSLEVISANYCFTIINTIHFLLGYIIIIFESNNKSGKFTNMQLKTNIVYYINHWLKLFINNHDCDVTAKFWNKFSFSILIVIICETTTADMYSFTSIHLFTYTKKQTLPYIVHNQTIECILTGMQLSDVYNSRFYQTSYTNITITSLFNCIVVHLLHSGCV